MKRYYSKRNIGNKHFIFKLKVKENKKVKKLESQLLNTKVFL